MFKGNIGTRTGRNVLEGKSIHCDSAGFDNFEDYFTDSDSSSPEKTNVETVRQNEIKSFLTTEKVVPDGDTTNFKFPSRKRLSFKADTNSESDFSSINFFTPRNRMISKRGMQSFPGEDEEEEKVNMKQQFSPLLDSVKRSFAENKSYNLVSSLSENRYSQMISKRGMKSFPGDDEEEEGVEEEEEEEGNDIPLFEIIDSSSPELIMEKMGDDQRQHVLLDGGKENQRNLDQIKNDGNSKKLSQKSSSQISQSSIELTPKSIKSMPLQNWYMWDDSNSLISRAKLIITPYGICEDTGAQNNIKNLGTNLQVIDEDESQQEYQTNFKSKLPGLHITEDSNAESNKNAKDQEKKDKRKSSPQKTSKTSEKKDSIKQQTAKQNKVRTSLSDADDFSESEETSPNEELSGAEKSSDKKKSLTGVDKSSGKKKSLTGVDKSSGKKKSLTGVDKSSSKKKSLTEVDKSSGKKSSLTGVNKSSSMQKSFLSSENGAETSASSSSSTKTSSKKSITSPMDKVRQQLNEIRKTAEPRIRVLPHRQKTVKTKISPISKKQLPRKQSLRSISTRSSSAEERHDSLSESSELVQPVSKRQSRTKKIHLTRTKGKVSPLKPTKPVIIRKGNKRKASDSPESIMPSKRAKTNKTPKSNLLARVLASKEKEDIKIKQKGISQQTNREQTGSGPKIAYQNPKQTKHDSGMGTLPRKRRTSGPLASEDSLMAFNQEYPKRISAEKFKIPAKSNCLSGYPKRISSEKTKSPAKSNRLSERRSSGPLASEDSLMAFNQGCTKKSSPEKTKRPAKSYRLSERRTSGPLFSEDSLVAFSKGYTKRISNEKPKSPAKSNRLSERRTSGPLFSEDSLMTYNKEDAREYNSNSEGEGETEWQCESCNCLIPVSLKACIFCGVCLQEGSQAKKKKQSSKKLHEKTENEQKTSSNPVGKTSQSQSPVLQKKSPNKRSSFSKKDSYTFNSYTSIKVDHKISYCVCSQSDVAMIGMMKIQRGGYRNRNCSLKEMFFTVLTGNVKVQVDDEERLLVCHDTFVVAKNGEYSIKNTANKMASLIFTIIK